MTEKVHTRAGIERTLWGYVLVQPLSGSDLFVEWYGESSTAVSFKATAMRDPYLYGSDVDVHELAAEGVLVDKTGRPVDPKEFEGRLRTPIGSADSLAAWERRRREQEQRDTRVR